MPAGATDTQKVEPQTPDVSLAKGAHKGLVVLGCLLVLLVIGCGIYNRAEGSETKEVTTPAKQKGGPEEKSTETKAVFSDTLLTALLGAGAALLVVGILYARISSITLPGGAKVELSADEAKQGIKEALDKVPAGTPPDAAAAKVTETLAELKQVKAQGVELPQQTIAETAARVVAPNADN
jgi:hypothetical protein